MIKKYNSDLVCRRYPVGGISHQLKGNNFQSHNYDEDLVSNNVTDQITCNNTWYYLQ